MEATFRADRSGEASCLTLALWPQECKCERVPLGRRRQEVHGQRVTRVGAEGGAGEHRKVMRWVGPGGRPEQRLEEGVAL